MKFLRLLGLINDDGVSHTSLYLYLGMVVILLKPIDSYTVALLTLIFTHTNLKRLSLHKKAKADHAKEIKLEEVKATVAKQNDQATAEFETLKATVTTLVNGQVSNSIMNQFRS